MYYVLCKTHYNSDSQIIGLLRAVGFFSIVCSLKNLNITINFPFYMGFDFSGFGFRILKSVLNLLPPWSVHCHQGKKQWMFNPLTPDLHLWLGFLLTSEVGLVMQTSHTDLFRCSCVMRNIHNRSPERRLSQTTQYQ